jgi:putative phosphoesterase
MKIAVMSDSHLNHESIQSNSAIFSRFKEICELYLNDVHLIIHLGDIQVFEIIEILSKYGPIEFVKGNVDSDQKIKQSPEVKIIESTETIKLPNNFKIAISHNRVNLYPFVNEQDIRIFLFGHSHIPIIEKNSKGQYWMNPGAIKRPAREIKYPSIGLIEISEDGNVSAEIKYYEK